MRPILADDREDPAIIRVANHHFPHDGIQSNGTGNDPPGALVSPLMISETNVISDRPRLEYLHRCVIHGGMALIHLLFVCLKECIKSYSQLQSPLGQDSIVSGDTPSFVCYIIIEYSSQLIPPLGTLEEV